MARDFFFARAQKAGGVVVENVALLLRGQKRRVFDAFDRRFDQARPDHLIRAEHHALAVAAVDDALSKICKKPDAVRRWRAY